MRSITRFILSAAVLASVIPCLFFLNGRGATARAEPQRAAAEAEDLAKRVAALEKVVLTDPFKPKDTVLARLDTIEEHLEAIDKAAQADGKGDDRSFDELQKAMEQQRRQNEAIEKRLQAVEERRKDAGADRGDELRELSRDIERLSKSTSDLVERVKKLEAQR